MAKFADYVKDDELNQEIQESEDKRNIPDSVLRRFDGKSPEDILESYAELEKKYSQQGNDLGELRKTVDQLVALQSQEAVNSSHNSDQDTSETVDPITVDDLYEDPENAISKVVDQRTQNRVQELEGELNSLKQKEAISELDRRYDGWQSEVQSQEFRDWVKERSYRARMAQAADNFDFDAANDLLEEWYDQKGREQQVQQRKERDRQLNDATLETSSPEQAYTPQTFSRHDLMEARIRAKRGDREAQRWLQSHADAIAVAYEEGRISD